MYSLFNASSVPERSTEFRNCWKLQPVRTNLFGDYDNKEIHMLFIALDEKHVSVLTVLLNPFLFEQLPFKSSVVTISYSIQVFLGLLSGCYLPINKCNEPSWKSLKIPPQNSGRSYKFFKRDNYIITCNFAIRHFPFGQHMDGDTGFHSIGIKSLVILQDSATINKFCKIKHIFLSVTRLSFLRRKKILWIL